MVSLLQAAAPLGPWGPIVPAPFFSVTSSSFDLFRFEPFRVFSFEQFWPEPFFVRRAFERRRAHRAMGRSGASINRTQTRPGHTSYFCDPNKPGCSRGRPFDENRSVAILAQFGNPALHSLWGRGSEDVLARGAGSEAIAPGAGSEDVLAPGAGSDAIAPEALMCGTSPRRT